LDLFAGVGLFTVALTKRFDRVIGVESNLGRCQGFGSQSSVKRRSFSDASSRDGGSVSFALAGTARLVVLDPPRAGVEPETLTRLKKLAPWRINYLSCDPATLARDLGALVGGQENPGPYEIRDINLFDIFPQTYHMEALVRLKRRT